MPNQRVLIRVDGGRLYGISLGHVFRCLALAKELKKNHHAQVTFIMKDYADGVAVVKNHGFQVQTISCEIGNDEEISIIEQCGGDVVVFDLVDIEEKRTGRLLGKVKRVIAIDDTGNKKIEADVVVNGSMVTRFHSYPPSDKPIAYYVGPQYCVLDEEFDNVPPREIRQEVEHVLISMGGSDPTGLSLKIAGQLASQMFSGIISLILGPAFKGEKEINAIIEKSKNRFMVHRNVRSMAEMMLRADVAISAGGRTVYELAATGTPAIVAPSAPHEMAFMDALMRLRANFCVLASIERPDDIVHNLALLQDRDRRTVMSRHGQKLIDGKGYKRVAEIVMQH